MYEFFRRHSLLIVALAWILRQRVDADRWTAGYMYCSIPLMEVLGFELCPTTDPITGKAWMMMMMMIHCASL